MQLAIAKNKSISHTNMLIILAIFIIYPLAAMPLIAYEIYRGQRYAYSLLAVFIGYIGLLYPPTGDLYRYTEDYFLYYNTDFKTFLSLTDLKMDYLFSFLLWILGKLHLNCDLSRFIYVWLSCELVFVVFYDLAFKAINPNIDKKYIFILFLILLLFTDFIGFTRRFGFSSALLLYGCYNIIYKNKTRGWIALIISCFNHFSYIIFLIGIIVIQLSCFKGKKSIAAVCLFCIIFLSSDIINDLVQVLPFDDKVLNHLLAYTDGKWAGDFLDDQSAKFRIKMLLDTIRLWALYIIYIWQFHKDKWSGILCMFLFIIAISCMSVTLRARMEWAALLIFLTYTLKLLLSERLNVKTRKIIIKTLLACGCLYLFTATWARRREYSLSNESKLLYCSSIEILCTSYSQEWINYNVYSDGAPVNY